jgi:diguanylate cyclase (GGDEF)-like protein
VPILIDGIHAGALAVYQDISEQIAADKAMQESEARFRSLFDDSPVSLWEEDFSQVKIFLDQLKASGVTDLAGYFEQTPNAVKHCARSVNVIDVNLATLKLYRATTKEDLLRDLGQIFGEESYPRFKEEILALASGETSYECGILQKTLEGKEIFAALRLSIAPGYEATWNKVFVSIMDITDRKHTEDHLRILSLTDALTGLYNRAYFDISIEKMNHEAVHPVAIFVFDLNDLKLINDTLGHATGDTALVTAAQLIQTTFRQGDIIARIGGDEFAAVIPGMTAKAAARAIVRLHDHIAQHNAGCVKTNYPSLSLSEGWAISQPGQNLMEVFNAADQAMYQDKLVKKKRIQNPSPNQG